MSAGSAKYRRTARERAKAQGLCLVCCKAPQEVSVECRPCCEARRKRVQARREYRIANSLCVYCGIPLTTWYASCDQCRAQRAAYAWAKSRVTP